MSEDDDEVPALARPRRGDLGFDLDRALASVVGVRTRILDGAFTAATLGSERAGSGVVIDSAGIVLTIGYLVVEAEEIWLTTAGGAAVAGHVLAYDQATGLALVQALGRLAAPALPLGVAEDLRVGSDVVVAGGRGHGDALAARVVGQRPFAGYWEYRLDRALFTAPAHPRWGGAACIDADGRLVGIGSLLVQSVTEDDNEVTGNMIVPVDVLLPILDDMRRAGRAPGPPRPWLGLFASDGPQGVQVTGVSSGGPAAIAGLSEGDVIIGIAGEAVAELDELWQRIWAIGSAGATIPMTVGRAGRMQSFEVVSADRELFLRRPRLH